MPTLTNEQWITKAERAKALVVAINGGSAIEFKPVDSDVWEEIKPNMTSLYMNPFAYRVKSLFAVGDTVQAPTKSSSTCTETFRATVVRVEDGVAVALRDKGNTAVAYNFDATNGKWILPAAPRKFKKVIRCESE